MRMRTAGPVKIGEPQKIGNHVAASAGKDCNRRGTFTGAATYRAKTS